MNRILTAALLVMWSTLAFAQIPPLAVDILSAEEKKIGKAEIYPNFIVLSDAVGNRKGAIGVVLVEGRMRLFLVQSGESRRLVGWGANQRIFDAEGKLVGYYYWTAIWSYVYDKSMKKVGQAQCLAYQGICAAGIAGYLLGLL